jgi:hypothetical protein
MPRLPVAIRLFASMAVLFAFRAAPLQGQVLIGYLVGEQLASPTFNMGFEVGVNFATLDGMGSASNIRPTVFGLFGDWRFSEHWQISGAFLPIAGRGAEGLTPVPTGDPAIDSQTRDGTMRRNIGVIELPLLIKWASKRESGFRVGVGPSFGFITRATDRYDATTTAGTAYVLERDIEEQLPGLDVGISFDVEWRFPIFSVAARYTSGLTDIAQQGATSEVHSRTLTGTGRIALGKKGKAR